MKILQFLRKLFEPKPEIIPQTGETWLLKSTAKGLWSSLDEVRVKILDVKSGWVRYDMGNIFSDERMKLSRFTAIYQKVN